MSRLIGKPAKKITMADKTFIPKTVYLVSLGCPKNLVDSEYLLGSLAQAGYEVASKPEDAGLIVVNTCGFIQAAAQEAVDTILEMSEYKGRIPGQRLVVMGCLTERYGRDLAQSLPEVDLFWGSDRLDRLPEAIEKNESRFGGRPGFAPHVPGPRLRSAPFYQAYLKIAEGCSHACAYCLIPKLRGPMQSRPVDTLVEEAVMLAETGVKELILVAQDTTRYGRDLGPEANLARLLEKLNGIEELAWIRIMYAYPGGLTRELTRAMADLPRVLPYLDLPLQHASPKILKAMGRGGGRNLFDLIDRLRSTIDGLTLRSTIMLGFPGETEADFEILMDFVEKVRFDHLGLFKFSPEDGTRAVELPDQVPQFIKEKRRRKLAALQRRIAREKNKALIGTVQPVLVDGKSSETDLLLAGRTKGQAPDIDGLVYISSGTASAGQIRNVSITHAHDYDLVGELVEDNGPA